MQVLCCPWVMSSCGHADQRLSQTDYPANSMPAADVISGPTPKSRAATVLRQRKGSSLPLGLGSLQARPPRFPHLAVFCTKYRFYDTTRLEMAATGECYRPPRVRIPSVTQHSPKRSVFCCEGPRHVRRHVFVDRHLSASGLLPHGGVDQPRTRATKAIE